jgi:hypothetical protein
MATVTSINKSVLWINKGRTNQHGRRRAFSFAWKGGKMKRICSVFLVLAILLCLFSPITAYAIGEGNIDGGGGSMGDGTSESYWNSGNEGVRITVVDAESHAPVTTPVDFTNKSPTNTQMHFGKVSKISYSGGQSLSPTTANYSYFNPAQVIPRIISTSSGGNNIEAIKRYFCSEYVLMRIAEVTGMNYEVMIGGDYKILLEPVAYFKYKGVMYAMSATEAALYDEQVSGNLRNAMASLTHKNLPLAMFLETPDLGYPAWSGSRTSSASNADIKSSLGLGIVRFSDAESPSELDGYDYEYRVNTEVITSVTVSGSQSDPDNPTTVRFNIGSQSYTVSNVYYPASDSQLVWVRWVTPSTPQDMVITVSVSGPGSPAQTNIYAKIMDLDKNPPPNPVADDRNDSFSAAPIPNRPQKTSAGWSIWRPWWQEYWVWIENWEQCWHSSWVDTSYTDEAGNTVSDGYWDDWYHWIDTGWWEDHGWWEFDLNQYSASLSATMTIAADSQNPTASGRTIKSGYGATQTVTANVSSNQSSAVTGAQNAVSYFPEFRYESYWRLLDRTGSGYSTRFQFKENRYSTYRNRTHFTPIWMPNGAYAVNTWLIDCWTPDGMLTMNLTDSLTIQGNLWQDWHVAPLKP